MRVSKDKELPVVVLKAYDLSLWMTQKVENFPRSYRFSVGERLVSSGIDLLLSLVDASYAQHKTPILAEANSMLNRLRFLLRMAKDLKLVTVDSYEFRDQVMSLSEIDASAFPAPEQFPAALFFPGSSNR